MRLILIAVLSVIGLPPAFVPGAAAPATHTVTIDASKFEPASLAVAPGDTVLFKNIDLFPHTATSRVGAFDSKEIAPGKTWKLVVPKKGRLFEYVCTLHPTMKGSLRVK
jgi:plastocyanin